MSYVTLTTASVSAAATLCDNMQLVFVGSGVSCGIPVIGHNDSTHPCACQDAIRRPYGHNSRNNVSLLITLPHKVAHASCPSMEGSLCGDAGEAEKEIAARSSSGQSGGVDACHATVLLSSQYSTNILIDCGKTFRSAYFRVLAPRKLRQVDALLVTHGHADAMQCVDQLCGLHDETARQFVSSAGTAKSHVHHMPASLLRIPTFLSEPTLNELRAVFPGLLRRCRCRTLDEHTIDVSTTARRDGCGGSIVDATQTTSQTVNVPQRSRADVCIADTPMIPHAGIWPVVTESTDSNAQTLQLSPGEGTGDAPLASLDCIVLPEDRPAPFCIAGLDTVAPAEPASMHRGGRLGSDDDRERANGAMLDAAGTNFPIYSLPVEHGKGYISLGFVFGRGVQFRSEAAGRASERIGSCVVYISDVSGIPTASMNFLRDLVKIDVLIIDLLAGKGVSSLPHYCWDDVMPLVRILCPRQTYCVGMYCSLLHDEANAEMQSDLDAERKRMAALSGSASDEERQLAHRFLSEVQRIELAYDGLTIDMPR